jgi:hypothetical protein
MRRKVKLGIVVALAVVMTASVAYAWIASNTLNFTTTLAGNPFTLTILDNFNARNIQSPPYLPSTIYFEEPIVLYTNTKNNANSAYSGVKTNYEIWRADGGAMDTSWVTVVVGDVNTNALIPLTFSYISDPSISGTANNALSAYIGPYTAPAYFSADANVTVTFHTGTPLFTFDAKVWVSVPP